MTDPTNTVAITLMSELQALAPAFAREGDAGADLTSTEKLLIPARGHRLVSTGIRIALHQGQAGLVYSRSGLAAKHGVFVLNAPGLIDAGYRGEIKVILANFSDEDYLVRPGDRIAQLVIQRVETPELLALSEDEFERLPATERGSGGFGSTGFAALVE